MQPMVVPSWNPGGYGNNQVTKIDVHVVAAPSPPSGHRTCSVCGHVYDPVKDCGGQAEPGKDCGTGVQFEDLADLWKCPVCGAPKSAYGTKVMPDGSTRWVEPVSYTHLTLPTKRIV
eukprot:TRINITY_DN4072_c0_g1_i1.p2 TRINITY_DN4072_c0_g1~~TRINITY_DN4072_c0_g1_i1.p2  ORF type:complete len:117 (-),score=15.39 TRINITY_DN4072_c0_g1_i1:132-482(-)